MPILPQLTLGYFFLLNRAQRNAAAAGGLGFLPTVLWGNDREMPLVILIYCPQADVVSARAKCRRTARCNYKGVKNYGSYI